MPRVLVVTDAAWVRNDVHAALSAPGYELHDESEPARASAAAAEADAEVAVVDLQVGQMGGMAITRALRNSPDGRRDVPVVILLDRRADAFLARRAGASGWLQKPFTAAELRTVIGDAIELAAEEAAPEPSE